jgi:hypothetical protein
VAGVPHGSRDKRLELVSVKALALQLPFDAGQQVFICSNPHARTHYY